MKHMTQQSILIVDDEPPMRKLLSTNVKARGYAVRLAADGTEALKLIEEHPFDRRRRSVANTKGVGRGGGRGRRGRVGRNLT
jgi:DNA-binding NtrC family response regulator